MRDATDASDFVGVGIYSVPEVAKLLRTPPRTIRRWMLGYDHTHGGHISRSEPLWSPELPEVDGQLEVSFRDMIELRFVSAFVGAGIGLLAVRNCLDYARECIGRDRPFSSGRFRTDGKTIFLESLNLANDIKLLDLRKKQYVFKTIVEQTFKDLDIENDVVRRWRPFRGKNTIVLDPLRSFGQPIMNASGVPTIVLAEAVAAEGSISRVASLYEVDEKSVIDAVKFHEELAAA